jgi:hypothetical protein
MGQGYVFAPPLMGSSFISLVEALDPIGEKNVAPSARHAA